LLITHALPFQAVIQVPIDIYLGKHQGGALVGVLALQVFWALALLALAHAALEAGTRKLVIQGG
jgi:ABC-2 type transport system permease protein